MSSIEKEKMETKLSVLLAVPEGPADVGVR